MSAQNQKASGIIGALAGMHDEQTALNRWLKKHPTTWPSAAVGPAGAVNQAYGVDAWPSHALIDGEGKLIVLGSFAAVKDALGAAD